MPKSAREWIDEAKKWTVPDEIRLRWETNQYFENGKQFLYEDTAGKRLIVLRPGAMIPHNGRLAPVPASIANYPIDNHLGVIARDITAQALANEMELAAGAATGEDEDRDAAESSTYALQYYYRKLKLSEIRSDLVDDFRPCGMAVVKLVWDPNLESGLGDPEVYDRAPQSMLIPPGYTKFKDLHAIGERQAMHVDTIYEKFKIKVEAEKGLKDPQKLTELDSTADDLQNHALVYEVFIKPCADYPDGWHVIGTETVELNGDGDIWDPHLMAEYPERWHPYIVGRWIKTRGQIYPKSIIDDEVPLQKELNKITKQISDAKRNPKGILIHDQNAFDWHKAKLDPDDGLPRLEKKPGTEFQFTKFDAPNVDLEQRKLSIIDRMNDIGSSFPSQRGNAQASPNVTSGKQAKMYQQASTTQRSPLLKSLAEMYLDLGEFILQMLAVHYPSNGRMIKLTGENEMPINLNFTPDQVRPHNIILQNGDSFYMMPDERRAETERIAGMGLYGDLTKDPIARAKFFKQMRMPDPGGMFDSIEKDLKMAKMENMMFKNGDLQETDPFIIQQIQQEYQAQMQEWAAAKQNFEQSFPMWQQQREEFEKEAPLFMAAQQERQEIVGMKMKSKGSAKLPGIIQGQPMDPGPPPVDPGPEPPQPPPWRRARFEDNWPVHEEEHLSFMKSWKFDQLCAKNPKLREAMYYHVFQSHPEMAAKLEKQKQGITQSILQPTPQIQPGQPVQ
jgi:hypothetical protein